MQKYNIFFTFSEENVTLCEGIVAENPRNAVKKAITVSAKSFKDLNFLSVKIVSEKGQIWLLKSKAKFVGPFAKKT